MNDEILAEVNYGIAWAKMMNSRGHSRRNKAPIFLTQRQARHVLKLLKADKKMNPQKAEKINASRITTK